MSNNRKQVLIVIILAVIAATIFGIGYAVEFNGENLIVLNGFIGIGTQTPEEELDVVGDIQLTGDIISDNDLTIKTGDGDLCLGNCDSAFLIGHFEFEDNVLDSSPLQNHGTVIGTEQYTTGQIGQGFNFDGSSYVTVANESDYDFERTDPFSVTLWLNRIDSGDIWVVTKSNNFFPDVGWRIFQYSGDDQLRINLDVGTTLLSILESTARNDGKWHHYAFTYSGNSLGTGVKIYVDGVLDVTGTTGTLTGSMLNELSVAVGARSNGAFPAPDGTFIDDVRIYSKELSENEVQDIYNEGSFKVHLEFEQNTNDSSVHANHGTVIGTEQYTAGQIGQAFDFDGSSYLHVGDESDFDFEHTDPFSISLWVRPVTGISNFDQIVAKGNELSFGAGYYIFWTSNNDKFGFKLADGSGGHTINSANDSAPLDTWTHIVMTYDGLSNTSGMKIYVNGVPSGAGTSFAISSTILNDVSLTTGALSNGGRTFDGQLDDVRIYSKELSATEVQDIYNGIS